MRPLSHQLLALFPPVLACAYLFLLRLVAVRQRWVDGFLAAQAAAVPVVLVAVGPGRPNILWLIAEDFGPHLGCYGTKEVSTPVLDGIAARIISELVALGGPAPWELVAAQIWPAGSEPESAEQPDLLDRTQLRRRWDISLARLRRKLRDARVRPDLVRACGTGQVELLLCSGDTVEDHV